MKESPTLGEQELDALRFVAENGPISAGQAARDFGVNRGLARTTVLTMMERLRQKGFLRRRLIDGVFLYSPAVDRQVVLTNLVADFVERSLGGSLAPFATYLSDSGRLSEKEIESLRRIVDSFDPQGSEPEVSAQ